jgi:transcriptional regulator with XRE-family HTH domain
MTAAKGRNREPAEGSVFPRQVLAGNIRAQRGLQHLKQSDLAERMSRFGHAWSRPTVSEVERGSRPVLVDELFGLAFALGVSVLGLLTPAPEAVQAVDVGWEKPLGTDLIEMSLGPDPGGPEVLWVENKPVRISFRQSVFRDRLAEALIRSGLSGDEVRKVMNRPHLPLSEGNQDILGGGAS